MVPEFTCVVCGERVNMTIRVVLGSREVEMCRPCAKKELPEEEFKKFFP